MNRFTPKSRLTLFPLIMSIFFVVSGGPYAMETLVSSSGAGVALVLILVTPFVWSLPAALMTAELTSAIPAEGGYYAAFAAYLAAKGFKELVKIDVLIYSAGLLLEFTALVVLRYKRPELARRYRIPGGKPVVWMLVLVPTVLIVAAFVITLRDDLDATKITVGALLSGPIVFWLAKLATRKLRNI